MFAGLLLGVVNAIVRPIAIIFTFPITIITLGFFLLVINAAMLALVACASARPARRGLPRGLLGALIVSITGWIGSALIGTRGMEFYSHRGR